MYEGHAVFPAWSNFYMIIGTSAASLTGLMFVVITLVTGGRVNIQEPAEGFAAFSTPTIVHFCAAFFISGVMTAPWWSTLPPEVLIGLTGLLGILYVARASASARRMRAYELLFEDWTWYIIVPFVVYVAVLATMLLLLWRTPAALFVLAGATMLLILMGIRNAWDVVTYLAAEQIKNQ